jgi:tRNA pseudouridine55 synthase
MSEEEFTTKLMALKGTYEQIPPLYSAKKIKGKKLYELMRAGETIDLSELQPKAITIKEINLLDFNYPFAKFEVACSEGTYIRSIARDLGGHLIALRRTESNGFDIKSAIRFEDLEDGDIQASDLLLNAADYLDLPEFEFNRKDVISLQQGRKVPLLELNTEDFALYLTKADEDRYLKCIDFDKSLVGLASVSIEKDDLCIAQPLVIL